MVVDSKMDPESTLLSEEYPYSLLTSTFPTSFLNTIGQMFTSQLVKNIKKGCIGVQLPHEQMMFFGESNVPSATVSIKNYNMVLKCLLRGEIGFAEAYMDGDFTTDNLPLLIFYLIQGSSARTTKGYGGFLACCLTALQKLSYWCLSGKSLVTAKRNIADHYDLGNMFFALFLDETMTYSSGIFSSASCSLKEAQLAKYDRLCAETGISKSDHVLDIGAGWGGFACYVVKKTGCKITAITLSHEQAIYTQELVEKEGLVDNITVIEMDYRQIPSRFPPGYFDVVISIEMIEHICPANYDVYFRIMYDCSTQTARIGLQAITRTEDEYDRHKRNPDFINQYIFPGGCLLSLGAVSKHATR